MSRGYLNPPGAFFSRADYTSDATMIAAAGSGPAEFFYGAGVHTLHGADFSGVTNGFVLRGAAAGATTLLHQASATLAMIITGSAITDHVQIRDLTLDGNRANQGAGVQDLVRFDGGAGAPIAFDRIGITSWRGRALHLTNTTAIRVRTLIVRDAAETLDSELVGGCGVLYAPSHDGYTDIGEWDCVQAALANSARGPWAIYLAGTANPSVAGSIETIVMERYGHQGATPSTDARAGIEVWNYGTQLTISDIDARLPAYSPVNIANSGRVNASVKVYSQNHDFGAPAILHQLGVHGISASFRDPSITAIASQFDAGAVVEFRGANGYQIVNPRSDIVARDCKQALKCSYTTAGQHNVLASDMTGTGAGNAVVYFGASNFGRARLFGTVSEADTYHVHVNGSDGTSPDFILDIQPGSGFLQSVATAAVAPIRVEDIQGFYLSHTHFPGDQTGILELDTIEEVRLHHCTAVSGATISTTAVTEFRSAGNTWQKATAAWNPASVPATTWAAAAATTVALADAAIGDAVTVTFSLDVQGTILRGAVAPAGTVNVYHDNPTGGAVDLGAGTLTVRTARG
jgi:hypothetical protein